MKESLKRSHAVAKEGADKYAIVTYDLAVAKIARQIQIQNSPKFDDWFLQFGQFHTILSLFSSIGKILEGNGATYLLSEGKIIAGGSINKFLRVKSCNRCRRGNLLLATGMHGLHLEKFIEDMNIPSTNLLQELENWAIVEDISEVPSNLHYMVTNYDLYLEEILNGKMGKTAQFWMTHAKIVGLIQLMQRAIKINDTALYSFALVEVTYIFFMTNHHNYACWMSLYSLDLANLEASQPNLQKFFTEGGFSINRIRKLFASVPVDIALEQTINENAKSRLEGIMAFADISTAVNRWIVTASMKSKILNAVLDCADMKISYDESKELRASRIRAEQNHLSKLKKVIKATVYPFSKQLKDFLFSIKTGTQASKDVEKYLLILFKCGEEKRDVFVRECSSTSERFIKPIHKTTVTTFASENFERKNKS